MSDVTAPAAAPALDLRVGAAVVYGGYGIGRVSQRGPGSSGDGTSECIVVQFDEGLSVTFPLDRALSCLRPVAGTRDVVRAGAVLRSSETSREQSWQVRTRSNRQKIASGETVSLAEVVRDCVRAHRPPAAGGSLSTRERELYLKARKLLAAELGAATGAGEAESEAWIEEQLRERPGHMQ